MMEWEKPEQHHYQQQHREELVVVNNNGSGGVNLNGNGGSLYVKVMTDEQLETLRKQIAVYATICEQLVEMHKTLTSHQDLAGIRLGSPYCEPLMISSGHKITSRQRWTPTSVQLQILERIFDQGTGTPSKQKIKEITSELSQHGQISETNVYNWFQNRRARSKRKQQNTAPNNVESEVETDTESPKDKKTKPQEFQSQQNSAPPSADDLCFQSPEISSDLHFLDSPTNKAETMFLSNGGLKPGRSLGQMSFYDGHEHLVGKMEVPERYGLYSNADNYNMSG